MRPLNLIRARWKYSHFRVSAADIAGLNSPYDVEDNAILFRIASSRRYRDELRVAAVQRLGDSDTPASIARNRTNPDAVRVAAIEQLRHGLLLEVLQEIAARDVEPLRLYVIGRISAGLERPDDVNWRKVAAELLGKNGDLSAVPRLMERLSDSDGGVRDASAQALAVLGWVAGTDEQRALQAIARKDWQQLRLIRPASVAPLVSVALAGYARRSLHRDDDREECLRIVVVLDSIDPDWRVLPIISQYIEAILMSLDRGDVREKAILMGYLQAKPAFDPLTCLAPAPRSRVCCEVRATARAHPPRSFFSIAARRSMVCPTASRPMRVTVA